MAAKHCAVTYTPCTTYNSSPCDQATTLQYHTFYTLAHHTNQFVLPPPIATISANTSLKTYYARDHNITPPLMTDWQCRRSTNYPPGCTVFQFSYPPGSICKLISWPLRQRFHCWRYFHCWQYLHWWRYLHCWRCPLLTIPNAEDNLLMMTYLQYIPRLLMMTNHILQYLMYHFTFNFKQDKSMTGWAPDVKLSHLPPANNCTPYYHHQHNYLILPFLAN